MFLSVKTFPRSDPSTGMRWKGENISLFLYLVKVSADSGIRSRCEYKVFVADGFSALRCDSLFLDIDAGHGCSELQVDLIIRVPLLVAHCELSRIVN